jgi:hypothetical protein
MFSLNVSEYGKNSIIKIKTGEEKVSRKEFLII